MTVYFSNKGEIDLDVIRTMGVSVKVGNNPIGFFGTGLKYAIATLLRTGHSVKLIVGGQPFQFLVRQKEIRGQPFDMVFMNDEQLAFTTDLGKNWKVWQAYRELHSNCLDEMGKISSHFEEADTVFCVSGPEINEVYADRHSIFLHGDPSWVVDGLEIHRGRSRYIFYRGVRVMDLPKKTEFTYNLITPCSLTEDRTLASPHDAFYKIGNRLPMIPDLEFHLSTLDPKKDVIETELDYGCCWEPSEEFLNAVESYKDHAELNKSARLSLKKARLKKSGRETITLSLNETMTVMEAINLLPPLFCYIKMEELNFVEFLGQGVEGMYEDGQIYIARSCIAKGVQWVASTIYEEWIHKQFGYEDKTRAMQQFLFDKIFQLLKEIKK